MPSLSATNDPATLASAVERQAAADGAYDTAAAALRLSRFPAPSDLVALVYEPCLCVVAQGAKEVLLADETYHLDPSQSLLASVDPPVAAHFKRVTAMSPLQYQKRLHLKEAQRLMLGQGNAFRVCWPTLPLEGPRHGPREIWHDRLAFAIHSC